MAGAYEQMTVRLDTTLKEQLRRAAFQERRSEADIVRVALAEYLTGLEMARVRGDVLVVGTGPKAGDER